MSQLNILSFQAALCKELLNDAEKSKAELKRCET